MKGRVTRVWIIERDQLKYFRTARAREVIAMECTEAISNSKRTSVEAEGPQDIITPRIALFNIYDIDATCDSKPHRVPG